MLDIKTEFKTFDHICMTTYINCVLLVDLLKIFIRILLYSTKLSTKYCIYHWVLQYVLKVIKNKIIEQQDHTKKNKLLIVRLCENLKNNLYIKKRTY